MRQDFASTKPQKRFNKTPFLQAAKGQMALVILAEKTKELNWKTLLNNVYDMAHCGKLKIFDQNGKLQIFVQKLNFLEKLAKH